jgi:hypothetical protein
MSEQPKKTRDAANDPRTHDGKFAKQHHDPVDTTKGVLDGLERQSEENAPKLLSEGNRTGVTGTDSYGGEVPADEQNPDVLAEADQSC